MAKETNKRINIWINGKEVENNVKSIRAAMVQLTNQLNKMDIGSAEYIETSKKLRDLKAIYDEHCKSLRTTNNEYHALSSSLKENILVAGGAAAVLQTMSNVMRRFVAATQEYVEAYASLDDAMTSVSKYTGLTREEVKQLNEEFRNMDTRTATEKLHALAADAGRLGITSKEAIKDFVEAADIINIALGEDLGEDAVKNIGKMATMFGESDKMGLRGAMIATASAVNTLAQSSSASEPYIMDFSARLAGVANTAGITQANIMGIASAMDQNMAQVEKSATAVQKIMMDMMSKTEKYAKLVGMSADEFKKLVDSDMNAAFLTVLDTLNNISQSGGSALAETFADLKLKGAGVQETLMMLAKNTDQLREAQQLATQAYSDGNSVISEAAAVNGNATAQLEKAKKAVQDAKAALGEELMPVITQLTNMSASGLAVVKEIVKFSLQHKGLVIALASAYGALYIAQKKVNAALKEGHALTLKNMAVGQAYKSVVFLLTAAKAKLAGATGAATLAQKQFKAAFASTPWGTIIVAIGAVVGGIVNLVEKQREARKATEEFNKACAQEQAEAEYLFGKLKKAEKGTKDYEDALQKLKEKYPEIIQKHIDEEGRLRDIEQAYKDVITQIQAKIALDMREKQNTDTIAKHTSEQLELFNKLRKRLSRDYTESQVKDMMDAIQTMTKAGKDSDAIFKTLQDNYGYTFSSGLFGIKGLLSDITNEQREMTEEVEATNKMFDPFIDNLTKSKDELDEIAEIDSQIAELQSRIYGAENKNEIRQQIEDLKRLKQQKLENMKASKGGSGSSDETGDPAEAEKRRKEVLKKREAFEKKLAQMREREQLNLLTGWEKTKQQIIDNYREMEEEAVKLYGQNSKKVEEVQAQRDQAIAEAGQKYIQDTSKIIDKAAQEIEKWKGELGKNGSNEIVDAVLGVQQKWAQRSEEVSKTLKDLEDTKALMADDNMDTTAIDEQIDKLKEHLNTLTSLTTQEISKTYQQYEQQTADFITAEAKAAKEATMTEVEKQQAAIKERYQLEIDNINKLIAAKMQNEVVDEAEIQSLRDKIELLKRMRTEALAAVSQNAGGGLRSKSVWQQLVEFDWSHLSDNWKQGLGLMNDALEDFASSAMSIFSSINQMQNNRAQAEYNQYCEVQDKKASELQDRLDKGLISQERYDEEIAKMEEEKAAKERKMQHEHFERERQSSIAEVIIQGGIAVARAFADYGWPWGLIPAALSTAQTAVQTALIASQVNPYAHGGFIDREQLALMGEEGPEWVASNKLLSDKKTAPLIAALEKYQRGDNKALSLLGISEPNWEKLSQSSRKLSSTFVSSSPVNNYYYTNSNNTAAADNSDVLTELKRMNGYLSDPKNRQAVISRKMQLEFDRMETELKQLARL